MSIILSAQEQLSKDNAELKDSLKNMEAEKIAIDQTAMELMQSNHRLKTQVILIQDRLNTMTQGMTIMSKQYIDEQAKVDKLEKELAELKGSAVLDGVHVDAAVNDVA